MTKREQRQAEWRTVSAGPHPLASVFRAMAITETQGMEWLAQSAYYPEGHFTETPTAFDLPWGEVEFLIGKAVESGKVNPDYGKLITVLISSLPSKVSKEKI